MHRNAQKSAGGASGPAPVSPKAHPIQKKRAAPVSPKACPIQKKRAASDPKEARDEEASDSGAGDNGGAEGTASPSATRDLLDRFARLHIQGQLQGAAGKAMLDELFRRAKEIVVKKKRLDMEKADVDKAVWSFYFKKNVEKRREKVIASFSVRGDSQVKKEEREKEKKVKKSSSTKGPPAREGSYSVTDSEDSEQIDHQVKQLEMDKVDVGNLFFEVKEEGEDEREVSEDVDEDVKTEGDYIVQHENSPRFLQEIHRAWDLIKKHSIEGEFKVWEIRVGRVFAKPRVKARFLGSAEAAEWYAEEGAESAEAEAAEWYAEEGAESAENEAAEWYAADRRC